MLVLRNYIDLPPRTPTDFDHGDVHRPTGRVFIAHTAQGTVEVVDGETGTHLVTIQGCAEGSGVLCAQEEGLVFAAARGAGIVLVIRAETGAVLRSVNVGPRPNGLAWDPGNRHLLVADVQENRVYPVDPFVVPAGRILTTVDLPGRPRWCVFDAAHNRFLVNIREPAAVAILAAATGHLEAQWPVSAAGPHGLDIDAEGGRAFVACDAGKVVVLYLATGAELGSVTIAGSPDATWYNARRGYLYVAIGNPGVLDVINTRTMKVEQRVPTEHGAGTTAYDEQRQRFYIFLPQTCRVAAYDEV